jgi:hypothetical protein
VTSFGYGVGTPHDLKFNVTIRTTNPGGVGSEGLYYKCIELRKYEILEKAGRCHAEIR